MSPKTRALAVVLPALCVGLAASAEPKAFAPGEQATYRVQYLGITAGSATITVGSEVKQWGSPVWPIVALAQSDTMLAVYPVKDKFVTYWDAQRQVTLGSDLFADENKKRRRMRIKVDHAK